MKPGPESEQSQTCEQKKCRQSMQAKWPLQPPSYSFGFSSRSGHTLTGSYQTTVTRQSSLDLCANVVGTPDDRSNVQPQWVT